MTMDTFERKRLAGTERLMEEGHCFAECLLCQPI